MRKILLSCLMLLGMGASAFADEVKTLEPDQEFTSIEAIGDNLFAICNLGEGKAIFNANAQNLGYDGYQVAFSASNSAYYWKLHSLKDDADESVKNCYTLEAVKADGSSLSLWGAPALFLNSGAPNGFDGCFVLGNGDKLGTDVKYGGVWEVAYTAGKGFTLKNKALGGYFCGVNPAPKGEDPVYWNFCTLKEKSVENPIAKPNRTATDALVLDLNDFTTIDEGATWDPVTMTFTKRCGFKWENGIDLSQYQYLVITAAQSRENAGAGNIAIKDLSGKTVQGDDYKGGPYAMWLSLWNALNSCVIDLENLRVDKMFDIYHVTELSIDGGDKFILGNVYATNFQTATTGRWADKNGEGNFRLTGLTDGVYGTVCLPYQAAVSGAYIYEIAGKNDKGIELKMFKGLMEAGKPYIYCPLKGFANGDGAFPENRVYFYQTTAATVSQPVENNGLIGTFEALGDADYLVLNNGKISLGNGVGANQAYINLEKVQGVATEATIAFDETVTGIQSVEAAPAATKIFDLSGRQVAQPTRGIYMMNGKKVIVK